MKNKVLVTLSAFTVCLSLTACNTGAAGHDVPIERSELSGTEVVSMDLTESETMPPASEEIREDSKAEDKNAEAYQAYLDFLTSHPELNISEWDNSPKRVISVCDCYGDDYPELIYTEGISYSGDGTIDGHELHIATYQNGQIAELPVNLSFDISAAAGGACISLFNSGNKKDLYYLYTYSDFGDDFDGRMCEFADLYKIDSPDKTLYSCACGWDSESGDDIYVYYKDGNKISESDFNSSIGEEVSNVKLIYQCHDNLENDVYGISKNMMEKADIMTYDEAVAFLQN